MLAVQLFPVPFPHFRLKWLSIQARIYVTMNPLTHRYGRNGKLAQHVKHAPAALNHPTSLVFTKVRDEPPTHFMTMEFGNGHTFRQLIYEHQTGLLPPDMDSNIAERRERWLESAAPYRARPFRYCAARTLCRWPGRLSLAVKNVVTSARLIFFCGKMAAGKSTLARQMAQREHALSRRNHRHNGIRQVFFAVEEGSRATHLCSLGEGHFRYPRFSGQHEGAACMVS